MDRVPTGPVGLVIEGEPGIGKTTVVLEVARDAGERRFQVLHARPAAAEVDFSFAGLSDLVRSRFDEVRDELPAPQRVALEVALLLGDADLPADPRTTAAALLTAVTLLGRGGPLVILIDDVQWLDLASRRAIQYLARRMPQGVGMVVASRSQSLPMAIDLGAALPAGDVERLVLRPLSLAALHELISSRLQLQLPRPMLVRIAETSDGNPMYALELAGAIARQGTQPGPGDRLPVPPSLHELLRDRVERLSPPAKAVATGAAALSRPSAETLDAAFGLDFAVEAALLEAEEAGILTSDGGQLAFSHPLLAAALYDSLTGTRLRALHRRLAAVAGDPEERARHLARGIRTDDEEAAAAIEHAAALATRRGAPESAAELYEAAARLTSAAQPEAGARRILGAANAQSLAGDLRRAESLARDALRLARTGSLRARALLLLGSLASYTETTAVRVNYQEQALLEAGGDEDLRIEILVALFEQIALDPPLAERRADEAISLLRRSTDQSRLAQALIMKFIARAVSGQGADDRLLREALALEAEGDGPASTYPLLWYHWIDDLEATRARHRLHDDQSRARGDVAGAAELVEFLAMAEFRAGNWLEAERAIDEACETLGSIDAHGPFLASLADRSVIDAHRGRMERARQTLSDILDGTAHLDPFWQLVGHSAQGAVEFCAGDHAAADRAWTAMRADAHALGWIDFLDDRSEPDHVEALVALGRVDEARRVLEHLEWRGRTLPRSWIDAALPRASAHVLAAEGHVAEALAAVEAAGDARALPFERARLLLVQGQLERRANRKLAARDSLTEALAAFEVLGSPPWARRARDELARIGLRHGPPDELTESERLIAELAAAGMTNRQVAERAFVSPKTVEANLARVYRKLGIRSRAELGARMAAGPEGRDAQT